MCITRRCTEHFSLNTQFKKSVQIPPAQCMKTNPSTQRKKDRAGDKPGEGEEPKKAAPLHGRLLWGGALVGKKRAGEKVNQV